MQRSVNVTVFGILFIVFNVFGLVGVALIPQSRRLLSEKPSIIEKPTKDLALQEQLLLAALFTSGIGNLPLQVLCNMAGIASGTGLLLFYGYARWLTLILAGIQLVWLLPNVLMLAAFSGPGGGRELMMAFLISALALNGLAIWYLLRPSVKAQFVSKGR